MVLLADERLDYVLMLGLDAGRLALSLHQLQSDFDWEWLE